MLKRLILFGATIIFILVVGYFLLSSYSVKYLRSKMQENLGPGISFTQVNATTRYVAGKGILIEEPQSKLKLLEVDEIRIYPAIRSLFTKSIILKSIVLYHPSFYVYRTKDSVIIGPGFKTATTKTPKKEGNQKFNITIDKITTKQGSLLFTDNEGLYPAAKTHLIQIESNIRNIKYPFVENKSPLTLKGKLSDEDHGDVDVNGWIKIKSSDIHLNASLTGADITKFEPYFKKKIGDIVEKGFATISSTFDIKNHLAETSGTLHLFDLHINENSQMLQGISSKDFSEIVKNNNNQLNAKFFAKGNLNDTSFHLSKEIVNSVVTDLSKSTGLSLGKKGIDTLKEKAEKEKNKIQDSIIKKFKKLF